MINTVSPHNLGIAKYVGLLILLIEYPIKSAEILVNGEFVLVENLTLDLLKSRGLYDSKARIKDQKCDIKTGGVIYKLNSGMLSNYF